MVWLRRNLSIEFSFLKSPIYVIFRYQHTFFAITLYCVPALAVHTILYSKLTRNRESALSLGLKVQARINGVNLIWALVTIGLTAFGFRSAYVFLVPVLVHLVTTGVIAILKLQNSSQCSTHFYFNENPKIIFRLCISS